MNLNAMNANFEDLQHIINSINKKSKRPVFTTARGYTPEKIPTGSLGLDIALGGGFPKGRMVVVWGNRSAAKTTLTFWTIANAQKAGKSCMFIDSEKAFDSDWAEKNGVDLDSLVFTRLSSVESILEATREPLQKGSVDLIVLDSMNGVNVERYYDSDNSIGLHARGIRQLMTKWNAWNDNALIVFISHSKTGFLSNGYPVQEHSGGSASEHFASVTVRLTSSRGKDSKVMTEIENENKVFESLYGYRTKWEITKSKISNPFATGNFILMKDGGVDKIDELIEYAVNYGVIKKSGAWFYIGDEKFQGSLALKDRLVSDPILTEGLTNGLFEKIENPDG